ncbi:hypothetical protein CCAN12_740069 [Capnocytophaga canimorsus]|uniref:Uncharacterized protein n=1 Tax=Capnocytophaga canimorsus TaxID=28188 RepID=A0A0B7HI00_9FLAO|nr:hypothetical protein CCAN12_740069 [Capnocytophaga canimorsus]
MPLPKPRINSGIFFPPNKRRIKITISAICQGLTTPKNIVENIIIPSLFATKIQKTNLKHLFQLQRSYKVTLKDFEAIFLAYS